MNFRHHEGFFHTWFKWFIIACIATPVLIGFAVVLFVIGGLIYAGTDEGKKQAERGVNQPAASPSPTPTPPVKTRKHHRANSNSNADDLDSRLDEVNDRLDELRQAELEEDPEGR